MRACHLLTDVSPGSGRVRYCGRERRVEEASARSTRGRGTEEGASAREKRPGRRTTLRRASGSVSAPPRTATELEERDAPLGKSVQSSCSSRPDFWLCAHGSSSVSSCSSHACRRGEERTLTGLKKPPSNEPWRMISLRGERERVGQQQLDDRGREGRGTHSGDMLGRKSG